MTSAAEARFRVQAPNSLPRAIKVIALDPDGEAVIDRLSRSGWLRATFFSASEPPGGLKDLSGHPRDLREEVNTADLVIMVAGPGGRAHGAPIIGAACSDRRVMTTALLVGTRAASDAALSQTLAQVRPWSLMVVMADGDEYIADMLAALRA